MPRITHAVQVPLGAYGDYGSVNVADYVYLAADTVNKEEVVLTGKELLLVRNADGAGAHPITITSVNDEFGRTGNVASYSIGISEFAMFGPFKQPGWRQTDGKLYFEADNVNIEFAVIRLP